MTNSDFLQCKEEKNKASFFKILHNADLSSETMRALPHEFVRNLSDDDLTRKMKIKTRWGSSWGIKISKNPIFYFMEKLGWTKFVRDNRLGDNEFITFTHQGNLRFSVNIFKQNHKEMLQPVFLASPSKTEQDVKKEAVLVSSEAGTSRARKHKRKLNAAASASTILTIKEAYIHYNLAIPIDFVKTHMPKPNKNSKCKIHHPDGERSWEVTYLAREGKTSSIFSAGWKRVTTEYPLSVGDTCKLSLIKPDEFLLEMYKQP